MTEVLWGHRPPPGPGPGVSTVWRAEPVTPGELTALRVGLRAALTDGARPDGADDDDIERLLLAYEELASNGLRHGLAPVRVVVTTTASGWLLEVTDAATDRPPLPAVDRDASEGGLGLYLVARLCAAHGWTVTAGRKSVWAQIEFARTRTPAQRPSLPHPRGETPGRSRSH
jgi:anti-sigma regulatory factor (Ser/Thr protein kinase)